MPGVNGNAPEVAFEEWVQRIPMRALKCRVQGHRLPEWDDHGHVRLYASNGIVHVETECTRRCGFSVTTFLDAGGFLARGKRVRYYDPQYRYLIPKEARGPGLTKERRAKLRREFLDRQQEWITQE